MIVCPGKFYLVSSDEGSYLGDGAWALHVKVVAVMGNIVKVMDEDGQCWNIKPEDVIRESAVQHFFND